MSVHNSNDPNCTCRRCLLARIDVVTAQRRAAGRAERYAQYAGKVSCRVPAKDGFRS